MQTEEIQRRVQSFERWHYEFDLNGVKTPLFDEGHRLRHEHRTRYFFDPLVSLCGGSLRGKRVLDLGCNAGFWSLQAINAGAEFVHGIDGRQMHVDQANLVFEALGIDESRYRFSVGDVLADDLKPHGSFDVVLCLGLLYHIAKPMELFENIAAVSTDVLLIDTEVSALSGSIVEYRRESIEDPRNAIDYELVMLPSRRAVIDMLDMFTYRAVILRPQLLDYTGMRDYLSGHRLAFMAAKHADLSQLAALPSEPPLAAPERYARSAIGRVRGIASAGPLLAKSSVNRRDAFRDLARGRSA